MSLTYERPSAPTLNGRSPSPPTCEITAPVGPVGSYSLAEIVVRTGVPRAVLALLAASGTGRDQGERYTAVDVVRLAVLDRLMRSGVPVARAAALVQAAETLATTTI